AAGCIFVFFAVVAIQGILLNLTPAHRIERVSGWMQGGLLAIFFLALLCSSPLAGWQRTAGAYRTWAPPVWFLGLSQTLAGNRDPVFASMARRAVEATLAAVMLAALAYLAAYRRHRRRLLETPEYLPQRKTRLWSWLRLLARDPRREAALQ